MKITHILIAVCAMTMACILAQAKEAPQTPVGGSRGDLCDLLTDGLQLGMNRSELTQVDGEAKTVSRKSKKGATAKESKRENNRDVFAKRTAREDGSIVALSYILDSNKCVCISGGQQVPVKNYKVVLSATLGKIRKHFGAVEPEERIKCDPVSKQERPCLMWTTDDRIVILDWTAINLVKESDKYGLIQIVVMEKTLPDGHLLERSLKSNTNSAVLFSAE